MSNFSELFETFFRVGTLPAYDNLNPLFFIIYSDNYLWPWKKNKTHPSQYETIIMMLVFDNRKQ